MGGAISIPPIIGKIGTVVASAAGLLGRYLLNRREKVEAAAPVDPKNSSVDEMAQANALLISLRRDMHEAAQEVIEQISREYKTTMYQIFSDFEQQVKGTESELVVQSYKRQFSRIEQEMDEVFENCVNREISMDNPDCLNILKMPQGATKGARMEALQKKVFKKAVEKVATQTNRTMEAFLEDLGQAVERYLDGLQAAASEKQEAYNSLLSSDSDEANTLDQMRCRYAFDEWKEALICELAEEVRQDGRDR